MSDKKSESPAEIASGDAALKSDSPKHHNSFTALRWLFALFVVFTHSFALAGQENAAPLLLGRSLASWGVLGFFILSGYLNSGSVHRNANNLGAAAFLLRRAFRILPLLWITTLAGTVIFWSLDGVTKWTVPAGVQFWAGNSLLYQPHFTLGSIFSRNLNTAFCGSIWTLPYEAAFYVIIATGGLGRLRGAAWMPHAILVALFSGMFLTASGSAPPWFGGIQSYYVGLFGFAFLCGMALMNFKAVLQSRWTLLVSTAIFASSAGLQLAKFPGGEMLQMAAFAVLVLRIGQLRGGAVSRWAGRWDASYGIYLFSFPIQQALIASGIRNPHHIFLLSALLSATGGLVSWQFLEKPMLGLGKRLSTRLLMRQEANRAPGLASKI